MLQNEPLLAELDPDQPRCIGNMWREDWTTRFTWLLVLGIFLPSTAVAFPRPGEVPSWLTDSTTYYERLESVVALGTAALLPLSEWLDDENTPESARQFVVAASAGIGHDKTVPLLSRIAWHDPAPDVRNAAAAVLFSMSFESVDAHVLSALHHAEHSALAFTVLQTRKVEGADDVLVPMLGDSDPIRRRAIASALLAQESTRALDALAELVMDHDPHLRACSFLARFIRGDPADAELTSIWRELSVSEASWAVQSLDLARFGPRFFEFLKVFCSQNSDYPCDYRSKAIVRALRDLALRRPQHIVHPTVESFVANALATSGLDHDGLLWWNDVGLQDPGVIIRAYGVDRVHGILARTLVSGPTRARVFAMDLCGWGTSSETLVLLERGMMDADPQVRRQAFKSISRRASKKDSVAHGLLSGSLSGEEPPIEAVLAGMESDDRALRELAVPWMVSYLRVASGEGCHSEWLDALTRRPWPQVLRTEIHRLLRTCAGRVCFDVISAIADTHDAESAAVVIAFLRRSSGALRTAVVRCLGQLGSPEVTATLMEIASNLADPDHLAAWTALGNVPDVRYCEHLVQMAARLPQWPMRQGLERVLGRCVLDDSVVKQFRTGLGAPDARRAISNARVLFYGRQLQDRDIELIGERLMSFDVRNLTAALEFFHEVVPEQLEAVWRSVEPIQESLLVTHPDLTKTILARCCRFGLDSARPAPLGMDRRCAAMGLADLGPPDPIGGFVKKSAPRVDCGSAPDAGLFRICQQVELLRTQKASTVTIWVEAARTWDKAARDWVETRLRQDTESCDLDALCELLRLDHPMNPKETMREILASHNSRCPAPAR